MPNTASELPIVSITDIATATGVPGHRVKYLFLKHGVKPVSRIGMTNVYGRDALELVRREVAAARKN